MTALASAPSVGARALWGVVALALPVSVSLTLGLGLGLMSLAGCAHLSPTLGAVGATVALLLVGALGASLVSHCHLARQARERVEQASVEIDDPDRLETLSRLAERLGAPCPSLRAIVSDTPVAFSLLGTPPAIVVSTWVFETLDPAEWNALVAHELAHLRRADRWVRWTGHWLLGASRLLPGAHATWRRIDAASEAAADQAAIAATGNTEAIASARAKFRAVGFDTPPASLQDAFAPLPTSERAAVTALGLLAVLPLVPLVVVPMCMAICVA
jgi:Zn-dependent protease with chaperone function